MDNCRSKSFVGIHTLQQRNAIVVQPVPSPTQGHTKKGPPCCTQAAFPGISRPPKTQPPFRVIGRGLVTQMIDVKYTERLDQINWLFKSNHAWAYVKTGTLGGEGGG